MGRGTARSAVEGRERSELRLRLRLRRPYTMLRMVPLPIAFRRQGGLGVKEPRDLGEIPCDKPYAEAPQPLRMTGAAVAARAEADDVGA